MYCPGPGEHFNNGTRMLGSSGLSTTEATIASPFIFYNPYDTQGMNQTAWSYLIKAVQFSMREAGLPVSVSGGMNQATESYLKRMFGDWGSVKWVDILGRIQSKASTLAKDVLDDQASIPKQIPTKTIAIAVGGIILLKALL